MVESKRGVNDPGAAWPVGPQALVFGVRSRPAVSICPMRRASSRPRPADLPGTGRHGFGLAACRPRGRRTAITSGSMRARRDVVQGSPLRSDRVLRTRLARVQVGSWTTVVFGERETLTAPLSERVTLAIA
jgi:hypothetical protein